jgi:glycosyltransferase involved in cell wall biosynthesis
MSGARPFEVALNGKFLAQPLTGVQRAAGELLRALDEDLARRPGGPVARWTVWLPEGVALPNWSCLQARVLAAPLGSLHLWEQIALPLATRGAARLVNLSGSAPWSAASRCAAMLHDAAVFDFPTAYRPAFVRWYRLLFRRLGRRAPLLLTPSVFSQQALAGVAPRLQVLPLGADHLDPVTPDASVFARVGRSSENAWPYLLAVGSLNPTKNFARLLQAFAQLAPQHPELRLLLVGEARPGVFAEAQRPQLADRVLWTGRVDDAALKALYAQAQALVFPSLLEGFGLPPLEAMRCGCPVIAARAGSLPEVLGDAALWVDPLDVGSIAAAITQLLADKALRERLREAGRMQASRYPWAVAGQRLRHAVEASL